MGGRLRVLRRHPEQDGGHVADLTVSGNDLRMVQQDAFVSIDDGTEQAVVKVPAEHDRSPSIIAFVWCSGIQLSAGRIDEGVFINASPAGDVLVPEQTPTERASRCGSPASARLVGQIGEEGRQFALTVLLEPFLRKVPPSMITVSIVLLRFSAEWKSAERTTSVSTRASLSNR